MRMGFLLWGIFIKLFWGKGSIFETFFLVAVGVVCVECLGVFEYFVFGSFDGNCLGCWGA
jgi:hypothetical protein